MILPDDPAELKRAAAAAESGEGGGSEGQTQTSSGEGSAQVTVLEPSKNVNDVIQQLLELSEQVTDPEATQQHIQQVPISPKLNMIMQEIISL